MFRVRKFLELLEEDILPENIAGLAAVNLEGNEALEVGIFLVGVGEISARFTIQEGLQMVTLTLDHDGIPAVPIEEAIALGGEGLLLFRGGFLAGSEPAATCFVVNPGSIGTFAILKVIVFSLVSRDPSIRLPVLLEGPEHAAGVPSLIEKLELEGENKIPVFLLGAQKGVPFDILTKAPERALLHFVRGRPADFFPAGEILAIQKWLKSSLFESSRVGLGREAGRELGCFAVVIAKGGNGESQGKKK